MRRSRQLKDLPDTGDVSVSENPTKEIGEKGEKKSGRHARRARPGAPGSWRGHYDRGCPRQPSRRPPRRLGALPGRGGAAGAKALEKHARSFSRCALNACASFRCSSFTALSSGASLRASASEILASSSKPSLICACASRKSAWERAGAEANQCALAERERARAPRNAAYLR